LAGSGGEERKGKMAGCSGNRGGGGPAKQRRRRKEGEGRRLTSGTQSSAKGKEKKKREAAWAGAWREWWAIGPPGQKGGEGFLCFFPFLFQTLFKSIF
jgi:hypothetical protein